MTFARSLVASCVLVAVSLSLPFVSGNRASVGRITRAGARLDSTAAVGCGDSSDPTDAPAGTLVEDTGTADTIAVSQLVGAAIVGSARPFVPTEEGALVPLSGAGRLLALPAPPASGRAPPSL